MVKELEDLSDLNHAMCVVDCYTDWCGPCKKLKPYFEELAEKYDGITFLKCNVDENDLLSEEYKEITSLPTFLFLRNCEEVLRVEGPSVDKLISLVESFYNNSF